MHKIYLNCHACLLLGFILFFLYGCKNPLSPETDNHIIEKSAQDHRTYHYYVLPNQIKVVLISDPTTKLAAAALNVQAGSADNPPERPGLAHFLEHMLFLGTEKYPDSSDYQSYISQLFCIRFNIYRSISYEQRTTVCNHNIHCSHFFNIASPANNFKNRF